MYFRQIYSRPGCTRDIGGGLPRQEFATFPQPGACFRLRASISRRRKSNRRKPSGWAPRIFIHRLFCHAHTPLPHTMRIAL